MTATCPCRRCDFRGDLADHAADSGHWLCPVCGNSLAEDEAKVCEGCITDTRRTLATILLLFEELPAHYGLSGTAMDGLRGGADGPPLPGGSVLALLAPGSPGGAARRLTRTDVERGVDGREHRVDNRPEDTPSVAFSLSSWATDWSAMRGDGVYPDPSC